MFMERADLESAIHEYKLDAITTSEKNITRGIMAAVSEAESYLYSKYDTAAIFSARDDKRHPTLLEHCVNLAIWYICRRANTDMIFEQVKEYRHEARDWLEKVSGMNREGKSLSIDLPLRTDSSGEVSMKIRAGSRRKFTHEFE